MRKLLRRLSFAVAGLLAIPLLAGAAIWIGAEIRLDKRYTDVPLTAPPRLAGDVANGKHWATILGCTNCHEKDLGGAVLEDSWIAGRLAAPNLTQKRKLYSDAELERMIRYGIKRDGHGAWLMPSDGFYHLDDRTIADVIAYVRSVPEVKREVPPTTNGPLARWWLLSGRYDLVTNSIDRHAPRLGDASRKMPLQQGRYIATVACTECHGIHQEGMPDDGTPNLAVAKAYTLPEFTELMHHGWAKGHRDVGFMSHIARERFSAFDDREILALKAWLDARPVVAKAAPSH
ncbi:MAG TPA: c-type cytochrome [Rhodanobacteraceae bacterium]|nr:c-type cytochrome [Rhodanobacteraceae bacterium]